MIRGAFIALLLLVIALPAHAEFSLLEMYRDEISRLVDTPGTSRSVAAGRINPASWPMQKRGGLFLSYDDLEGSNDVDDFTGVLSLGNLGLGVRHVSIGDANWTDYTLGVGFGSRGATMGFAYSWNRGDYVDAPTFGNTERLTSGSIYRWSWGSLGLNTVFDFDADQSLDQVDLGLRPFGPRWTLFADYLGWREGKNAFQWDYDDEVYGYGIELRPVPGIGLAFRADDEGNLGFRVNVAYDQLRPSVRHRVDNDSDRIGTTYAVEFGEGPNLRDVFPSGRNYPELHWNGPISYRRYGWFDDRPRMISRLNQINEIAQDPEVEGIILNLSGMQASIANLWEIRAQLAGMRAQGKKVIVYFDRLGASGYMLASVADEIWIDPMGGISLNGINFGRSYYSRMLEKVGIGFDEWRFFKYKSAAESFSRTEFSEGEKEQLTDLMNDFYGSVVEEILEGRGIAREDWDHVVNTMGELLPEEAERLGLVDGIGDFNDLRVDAHNVVARPGTDSHTAPIGPVLGDRIWRGEEWGEAPAIAVLYAIGPCEMDGGIRGRQLSKLIRQMRENPKVKAVVLRADSPGGDPLPSDLVARELKLTSEVKPVIVSQGQVAGSGGYWISMYGDEIHASPFTVTGSIGVISGHLYDNGLMDRLGIDYDHVQIGDSADLDAGPRLPLVGIGLPHRPPTDAERARVKEVILELYETFMEEVAEGRHLEMDTVRDLAQGHIYSGTRGQEIGLVDEIGGLWSAIVRAKQLAGLDGDDRIRIVEGPQLGLFPPSLLSPSLIAARAKAQWQGESAFQPLTVAADLALDSEAMPSIFADVVSDEQWAAMPVLERLYLLRMLKSSGRASVMMDPIDLGDWMGELR